MRGAARAAADCATVGMLHALSGGRPEVVAVRAVKAMAVAISTSRAYAAFVAAAAAAESVASICAQDPVGCGNWPPELVARRVQDAYNAALDRVMGPDAAGDAWVLFDNDFRLSKPRPGIPFTTDSTVPFEPSPGRQIAVRNLTTNFIMYMSQRHT